MDEQICMFAYEHFSPYLFHLKSFTYPDDVLVYWQVTDGVRLGTKVMENNDVFTEKRWFWIGAAALLGFTVLFNILFTFALMYLNRE